MARKAKGQGPCSRRLVGKPERRILVKFVKDGIEHAYHATKGWRRTRVAKVQHD